jgi:hypothetical protein
MQLKRTNTHVFGMSNIGGLHPNAIQNNVTAPFELNSFLCAE